MAVWEDEEFVTEMEPKSFFYKVVVETNSIFTHPGNEKCCSNRSFFSVRFFNVVCFLWH